MMTYKLCINIQDLDENSRFLLNISIIGNNLKVNHNCRELKLKKKKSAPRCHTVLCDICERLTSAE